MMICICHRSWLKLLVTFNRYWKKRYVYTLREVLVHYEFVKRIENLEDTKYLPTFLSWYSINCLFIMQFLCLYLYLCLYLRLVAQMSNLLQTIQLLLPLLLTRIGPHLNFHNFRSFPTGLMDSRTLLQLSMYIFHNSKNDLTLLRTLYQIFSVKFSISFST